jgi:hypothetical protein
MATYVISDIHGQYDMFMDLLEKISLTDKINSTFSGISLIVDHIL